MPNKAKEQLSHRQTGTSPGWQKKSAAHWRNVCRSWSTAGRSLTKTADLGGSPSAPFEQAFSNLAHSYLTDRAPKLVDYEQGFQLIDKSEDNTKAVGVFGFKIGNQWLYAPVFFLNGELRGHELLYIKNQDMFVPMKDNWVNYLLGRKPNILGRQVGRNLAQLGVLQPNLYQLSRSPYKIASADLGPNAPRLASWVTDFIPVLAELAMTKVAFPDSELFLSAARTAGRDGFDFITKTAEHYPTVFQAARQFYGDDKLTKLSGDIGDDLRRQTGNPLLRKAPTPVTGSFIERVTKQAGKKNLPEVEVIVRRDIYGANAPDMKLTDTERTELAEEGRVVRDKREDSAISQVYNLSTSLKLSTPTETGIYDILVKPDKFEKCLVIMAPYGGSGREYFCTVISLEEEKRWLNIHPTRVFYRTQYSQQAWNSWFDKLDDAKELTLAKSRYSGGPMVVLLSRNGQGTCPLRASEKYEGGGDAYEVRFDDYCNWREGKSLIGRSSSTSYSPLRGDGYEGQSNIDIVRFTERQGTKFRAGRDELYVPVGFKKLTVESEKAEDETKDDSPVECCDGGSNRKPLQPGNLSDIMFAIQANLPPLKISSGGSDFDINGRKTTKEGAFKHLVVDWGMRAETADLLLKTAEDSRRQATEYRVKLAGPHLTEGGGPSAPGIPEQPYASDYMMGSQMPMQMPHEVEQNVQSMMPNRSDRSQYSATGPDPDAMRMAGEAAQTGQKEVFDTAMLGSMLNTVRQDSMIDRYLGDLMKGMDRLGRIYFQYLWHGQEFEDRFGASELPVLIDGIRNTFEGLGDLNLKLKQKGVDTAFDGSGDGGTEIDLGGVANR